MSGADEKAGLTSLFVGASRLGLAGRKVDENVCYGIRQMPARRRSLPEAEASSRRSHPLSAGAPLFQAIDNDMGSSTRSAV